LALVLKKEKHFCSVCLKLNEYEIIVENDDAQEFDLDTRPHGSQRYALIKSVHTCPYCHYSNFDIDTEIEGIILKDVVNSAAYEELCSLPMNEDAKKFMLAAYLYEQAEDFVAAGYLYLNCAWMLDDSDDGENARDIRRHAVLNFSKTKQLPDIVIIECDLMRRTKAFTEAAMLAKNTLNDKTLSDEQREMFRQEIALCKQKRSEAVKFVREKPSFLKKLFRR